MPDLMIALKWWLVSGLIGIAVWPVVAKIFRGWAGGAYLIAKISGLLCLGLCIWLGGSFKLIPFSFWSAWGMLAMIGIWSWLRWGKSTAQEWRTAIKDEILFLGAFGIWTWIKGHAPEINGLEKFMDFGFAQSISNSRFFPPADMWFAGTTINYYYFGHLLMAMIAKMSAVDLTYGFNLMLSTLFGLTFSMSYAIGRELLAGTGKKFVNWGAVLIAVLVSLSGNLQTVYAFTKGYQGDTPPPFWQIFSNPFDKDEFAAGWEKYWYPNATRFIPYTIHEFPGYSFVVSDIHGHVLAIPIALLMLAILVHAYKNGGSDLSPTESVIYGVTAGAAMMTNALDGPIYIGLLIWLTAIRFWLNRPRVFKLKLIGLCLSVGAFLITVSPFLAQFKPFVSGIGVNCPPSFLAGKSFGPLIFEETGKCQRSPLWMMALLWGFFGFWAITAARKIPDEEKYKKLAMGFSWFCFGLIIFPEFFYFKDIYPLHFRSNTMFKLGYQVFIIMSLVSGWTICYLIVKRKQIKYSGRYLAVGLPLLILVLIYPYFSVKSYFGGLKNYQGLYGLEWLRSGYHENWKVIEWLRKSGYEADNFAILEAQGDSYYDPTSHKPYNQISAFTGIPTVAGWYVHEWLWRGQEQISARATEVREIYETPDGQAALAKLKKYRVKYVVVGEMEREKYKRLNEDKFVRISELVYTSGQTRVYEVP